MKRKNQTSTPSCDDCIINSISVFNKLTIDELNLLNYEKICQVFKKGTTIYNEGSRISGCYCIHNGIIKLYKTGFEGREHIIRFAKKGDIIGYRSLLSNDFACHTAKVLEDSQVCFIPGETLFQLLENNSKFSLEMLKLACVELGEANAFITDIAQKTVKERLAEVLLILKDTFGLDEEQNLQIVLTREELGNIIGTATESVIRLLGEFKENKWIEINGRKLKLLDIKALQKVSAKK
ncbi:MAG: Crp/Fnr family transcriptional regulator [Bacteroidales bacterium]|nr:Crp/Fnr family transcriptional regulator [Bacteroidales bacterium]